MLTNTGGAKTIRLVYPVPFFSEEEFNTRFSPFQITVDGTVLTEWWGASPSAEFIADMFNDRAAGYLLDGTYFRQAFPNWPEQGTPCVPAVTPEDSPVGLWTDYLVYFCEEIQIPAGGSATVTAQYDQDWFHEVQFSPCFGGIPCQSHTLNVINAGKADEILMQNTFLNIHDGRDTVTLDPGRTNYYIRFNCWFCEKYGATEPS